MNERLINIYTWRTKALKFIRDCILDMYEVWLSRIDIASQLNIRVEQVSRIANSKDSSLSENKIQAILDILYDKK